MFYGAKTPCMGCAERKPGCHGTCERYADCIKTTKEANEERERQSRINAYIKAEVLKNKDKTQRN